VIKVSMLQTLEATYEQKHSTTAGFDEFQFTGKNISFLSIRNERRVLQRLSKICLNRLINYRSSLKEDENILNGDKCLSFN
jgi:hypothetical protein